MQIFTVLLRVHVSVFRDLGQLFYYLFSNSISIIKLSFCSKSQFISRVSTVDLFTHVRLAKSPHGHPVIPPRVQSWVSDLTWALKSSPFPSQTISIREQVLQNRADCHCPQDIHFLDPNYLCFCCMVPTLCFNIPTLGCAFYHVTAWALGMWVSGKELA